MADRIGQQLGSYRLVRLLGEGGFAEVYLGEHMYLKTQVAVKVLHLHLVQEEFSGFLQEAQTIAHLKHPHIISVFDFGIDGVPFLVMDYLPQGSLRERYPRGTSVPLPTIVPYVNQVAAALQYAHDMKVIHRDIKPANILMRSNDQIILSDFGIATAAHRTTSLQTMNSTGSPSYMAPEHVAGKPRPASDQYSLAIVVYEWLCGKLPFQGEPLAVMYKQTYDPVPSLREQVPTMVPEVEQVVLTALAKDPQQRFGSVLAFATALEQACQTAPSSPVSLSMKTTLPSEPSPPTDGVVAISPSQPPLPAPVVTPPSQSPLPPEAVEGQSPQAPPATILPTVPIAPLSLRQPKKEEMVAVMKESVSSRGSPPPAYSLPKGLSQTEPKSVRMRNITLLVLAVIIVISGAAYWGSSSQIAAKNVAATATLTAQNPNPYPPKGGRLVLYDSLSNNSNGNSWEDYRGSNISCQFVGGAYHVVDSSDFGRPCLAQATNFGNFTYEVHLMFVRAKQSSVGGVVIRNSGNNYYSFVIFESGSYAFYACRGNDCTHSLADSQSQSIPSFHVGLNQPNTIAIVAKDNTFNLYVNDQHIAGPVTDTISPVSSGMIGVYGQGDGGVSTTTTEIVYSNAKVWAS